MLAGDGKSKSSKDDVEERKAARKRKIKERKIARREREERVERDATAYVERDSKERIAMMEHQGMRLKPGAVDVVSMSRWRVAVRHADRIEKQRHLQPKAMVQYRQPEYDFLSIESQSNWDPAILQADVSALRFGTGLAVNASHFDAIQDAPEIFRRGLKALVCRNIAQNSRADDDEYQWIEDGLIGIARSCPNLELIEFSGADSLEIPQPMTCEESYFEALGELRNLQSLIIACKPDAQGEIQFDRLKKALDFYEPLSGPKSFPALRYLEIRNFTNEMDMQNTPWRRFKDATLLRPELEIVYSSQGLTRLYRGGRQSLLERGEYAPYEWDFESQHSSDYHESDTDISEPEYEPIPGHLQASYSAPQPASKLVRRFWKDEDWGPSKLEGSFERVVFGSGFCIQDTHIDAICSLPEEVRRPIKNIEFGHSLTGTGASITDAAIDRLARSCQSLVKVTFYSALNLTDQAVKSLLLHCPQIQDIHISGTEEAPGRVKGFFFKDLLKNPELGRHVKRMYLVDQRLFKEALKRFSKDRPVVTIIEGKSVRQGIATWRHGHKVELDMNMEWDQALLMKVFLDMTASHESR